TFSRRTCSTASSPTSKNPPAPPSSRSTSPRLPLPSPPPSRPKSAPPPSLLLDQSTARRGRRHLTSIHARPRRWPPPGAASRALLTTEPLFARVRPVALHRATQELALLLLAAIK